MEELHTQQKGVSSCQLPYPFPRGNFTVTLWRKWHMSLIYRREPASKGWVILKWGEFDSVLGVLFFFSVLASLFSLLFSKQRKDPIQRGKSWSFEFLVSCGCLNKLPPTTKVYCLTVLEARSTESRCQQGYTPSKGSRRDSFILFQLQVALGIPQLICAFVSSSCVFSSVSSKDICHLIQDLPR